MPPILDRLEGNQMRTVFEDFGQALRVRWKSQELKPSTESIECLFQINALEMGDRHGSSPDENKTTRDHSGNARLNLECFHSVCDPKLDS